MDLKKIDPLIRKTQGKPPELLGGIEMVKDPVVDHVLDTYQTAKEYYDQFKGKYQSKADSYISELDLGVLNGGQIDIVLQKLIHSEELLPNRFVGFFLTRLIQDSYYGGHNDFVLTTRDSLIDSLGYNLKGTLERKLELHVRGNIGSNFGPYAQHTVLVAEGNVGAFCGSSSSFNSFLIKGNARNHCGFYSHYNLFTIEGGVGGCCGRLSHHNTFSFYGDVGDSCGHNSHHNTFLSLDKEVYKKVRKMVPRRKRFFLPTRNKVVYQQK